ncbi:MAG: MBL fold metallo-hydrolase [Gammaproteobacteria bacterium]|nr:MAG: MBL fold metallo-hydrolase [Gammaproteobacteria bacterium]
MNRTRPTIRQAFTLVMLSMVSVGWLPADAAPPSKPERSAFGTDSDRYYLPKKAIDTTEVPSIVLKEADGWDQPLPYFELKKNVYMLFGNIAEIDEFNRGWNGNAGFIVTPDGVVVIDSLGTPKLGQRMIATIKSVTQKPIKYLIITHNHPDHSYGAVAFRKLGGVTIISHEGARDYIDSDQMNASVAFRRSIIDADMKGFKGVLPDITISGKRFSKYDLKFGGQMFHIYNVGQHHSAGDLVVHAKKDDVVWISDLAFNQRTTFMGDGNSRQAIESQDWLLTRFANTSLMVPGHGSAQTKPFDMVRKTQSYMKRLRATMLEAITNDVDLFEAVKQAEFADWKDIRLYDLNQRTNANFVYRELELENF